jgi:tripartite-type tricarboxylate transporter receptor subunit TctC
MRASLDQPVIIENVGAAGGTVGVGRVARAAPDGYTVGIGQWGTHVVNGAIYALSYDLLDDFEPIALIATAPLLIVSRSDFPAMDLRELIAWLKANPGKATQGTTGPGSPPHIAGTYIQKITDTRFLFVPYRGAAPAMQDLIAGHIDLNILQAAVVLPQVSAGTIRAFAVMAKNRLAAAPNIPTVDEAGLPGLYVSLWHGLWAPKGTPNAVSAKLNASVVDALTDPAVYSRLADLGQELFPPEQRTPEALGAFQRAEIAKWWPIIKAANIKGE